MSLNKKIYAAILILLIIIVLLILGTTRNNKTPQHNISRQKPQSNNLPKNKTSQQEQIKFSFTPIKKKMIYEDGYYPDIDCRDNKVYVSFVGKENSKVAYVLDENLDVLNGPIKLEKGPDHEIVILGDYFYMALEFVPHDSENSVWLIKYDKNFNEIKRIKVKKLDKDEEGNDQFLSKIDGKLYLTTTIFNKQDVLLRVFDKNLELLKTTYLKNPGHILKYGDGWAVIRTNYATEPKEIRLMADIYNKDFEYISSKNLTSEKNYQDAYQLMPYDVKKFLGEIFVTHRSSNGMKGKGNAHGYLSIFDSNFNLIQKLKISDHDEKIYTLAFPRFCILGDKIFFIYGLHSTKDVGGLSQDIYVRKFEFKPNKAQ